MMWLAAAKLTIQPIQLHFVNLLVLPRVALDSLCVELPLREEADLSLMLAFFSFFSFLFLLLLQCPLSSVVVLTLLPHETSEQQPLYTYVNTYTYMETKRVNIRV